MKELVRVQQEEDTWNYFSGLMRTVVYGVMLLARQQRVEDVWRCFSGFVRRIVRGDFLTCGACCGRRTFSYAAVGSFEWLSVECRNMQACSWKRTFGGTSVGSWYMAAHGMKELVLLRR